MSNPVYQNEVKMSVRTARLALLIMGFNGILAVLSLLSLYGAVNRSRYFGSVQFASVIQTYSTVVFIEFAMFMLLVPAITAGSISGEKERKTLDLLLTSRMTPMSIVFGKLKASLNLVIILVVSSLPVLSLVFIFGGIRIRDLFLVLAALLISGFFAGSLGILFSTVSRKTTTATVFSYGSMIALIFGSYGVMILLQYLNTNNIGNFTNGIGKGIYLLIVNPAVSFIALVYSQVSNEDYIAGLCSTYAPLEQGFIIDNWVLISLLVQILVSVLLLLLSSWLLNPLHAVSLPGRKHLEEH
ncbi:MAG: ABC transporter permease subunit [Lachnospiraceae bacterium]|nr:ABC transporter permease subunit [Lachnospiraceae bacterium]